MKVLFGIINSLVRFLQQNIKLNRILLCCVITSCWKCTESFNVQRSSLEIQNTQSTITMPEFTTEESMFISRPGVKNHEAILKQCEYFPTKRLRELCERIAENPIIVAMKEHARGHLKETLWTTSITKSDMPLGPQQGIKCPQYSYDTLPNVASLRSLSPWKMMPEYDRLRYPQWIPVAKCMCTGCIDQRTGKENFDNISQEIKVKLRFLRMNATHTSFRQCTDQTCYPSDEDVAVGCHCAIPFSGNS